jgi:hypothetical protein
MKPVPSFEAQPEDFGPFTTVYTFNQVKDIRRIAIQETKKHCEERIEALVKEDGQAIATLQGIIREMDMRINYFAKSNQSLDEQVCSYRNQFAEQCEKSQELQLESNNLRSLLQLATDTYRKLGAENKKLNRQLKAQHKLSEQLERKICSFDEDFEKLCGRLETARSLALALDITVAQVAPEQQADEDVDVVPPSPPASPSSNTRAASPARVFEGESADGFEFDGDPAGFGGRGVGEGGLGDFGETGDGLRPNAFVEQHGIAGAHGVEVVAGLIIADAGPRGAALAHEGGPSVGFGFRFHEPVLRLLFHGGSFA